jgi:hypothetical protein
MTALFESRVGRYVAYAAGEIVLIFIGITLALAFSNWNESRRLRSIELATLEDIAGNLQVNVDSFEANIAADRSSIADCARIAGLLESRAAWSSEHSSIMGNCRIWSSPYLQGAAYESLRQRGTDLVSNRTVRNAVINLYENTYAELIGDVDQMQWSFETSTWTPVYVRNLRHRSFVDVMPSDYAQLLNDTEFLNALFRHISLLETAVREQETALEATRSVLQQVLQETATHATRSRI